MSTSTCPMPAGPGRSRRARRPESVSTWRLVRRVSPFIVHILAQAADAVAAHLSPGAIGVVHLHGKVPPPAGADADQAIRPPHQSGGRRAGPPDRRGRGTVGEAVEVDVVVSQPLHFGEAHAITPFGARRARRSGGWICAGRRNMPQLSLRPGRGSAGRSGPV